MALGQPERTCLNIQNVPLSQNHADLVNTPFGQSGVYQHPILEGYFYALLYCKNCNACLERPKINEIEAGNGPFYKTIPVCVPKHSRS